MESSVNAAREQIKRIDTSEDVYSATVRLLAFPALSGTCPAASTDNSAAASVVSAHLAGTAAAANAVLTPATVPTTAANNVTANAATTSP